MAKITMREAISQALMEEMDRDPAVFIMGEEVGVWGGTYAVTKGFYDKYGPQRVKDTPIAENAIIGAAIGGGIIFGLTDNLCSEISAIYNRFDFNSGNGTTAVGEFTDFSLGAQYRFMPGSRFVPYVGAGLDFFYNDFDPVPDERLHNDNSFGGHLQAGMDYFLTRTLALNVELRGAIATEADISRNGVLIVKYDPSNLSGLIGIRFFY